MNKGRHFPFRFDNRHKVNVVVSRKLSRKVELTGAWVFASGNHISLPEYKYLSPIYQKRERVCRSRFIQTDEFRFEHS